jgi:hypothetical protein
VGGGALAEVGQEQPGQGRDAPGGAGADRDQREPLGGRLLPELAGDQRVEPARQRSARNREAGEERGGCEEHASAPGDVAEPWHLRSKSS